MYSQHKEHNTKDLISCYSTNDRVQQQCIYLNFFLYKQKVVEIEEIQLNISEAPLPASAFPTSPIPSSLSDPTHTMPSQIYGPEHLLRLFGKISQHKVLLSLSFLGLYT